MSAGFLWLRDYDADRRSASLDIAQTRTAFKILLKTKDEPILLRMWIEHHLKIVDASSILIFDHGSTDPEVEKIYREYSPGISVFRYGGFHNVIHHRRYHPELYEALKGSCFYYLFIDTDEYLVSTDGKSIICDGSIVDLVCQHRNVCFYPGVWLQNIMGYRNRFQASTNKQTLIAGLKWGKPILASDMDAAEIQMHNMQIFECYRAATFRTNFLVLHRSFMSPGQRVKANMRKLIAYGVITREDDVASVLAIRPEEHNVPTCQRFIREIHDLACLPENSLGSTFQSIELSDGGSITFKSAEQEIAFASFICEPDPGWVNWI